MSSLQELCANCLISNAPARSASGIPRTYHARIPWQRTTSPPTEAQKHRAIFMYTAFPRDLYSAECHTCIYVCVLLFVHVLCNFMSMYCATLCPCIVQLYVHILCNLLSTPKGAKVYPASRRRCNKRVWLKGQLAPHCVPWLKYYIMAYKRLFTSLGSKTLNTFSLGLGEPQFKTQL